MPRTIAVREAEHQSFPVAQGRAGPLGWLRPASEADGTSEEAKSREASNVDAHAVASHARTGFALCPFSMFRPALAAGRGRAQRPSPTLPTASTRIPSR